MPFLTVKDTKLFYNDSRPSGGASARSTYIFHHGMGSSSGFFWPIVSILTSEPHFARCVSFDAEGCGRSSTGTGQTSFALMAEHTTAILDHLQIEKAILVSHSISSVMAPSLLLQQSHRFQAAILLGPVLPSARVSTAISARLASLEERDEMEKLATAYSVSATASSSTPVQRAFVRELLLRSDEPTYKAMCQAVVSATRPEYQSLRHPILLITGDEDKSSPPEVTAEVLGLIGSPVKEMVVLPHVGHQHCVEDPTGVAGAIVSFIDSVGA